MVKKNFLIISLGLILVGFILRIYNLNYESYWWDEMLGFWTANPNISFLETYARHINNDYTSIAYHLFLKSYYFFFGYIPEHGRYLTMLIGVVCIPLMGILMKQLYNDKLPIYFAMFLTSFNVFLIEYSQENRVYILIFLVSVLNLIYFSKLIFKKEKLISNFVLYLVLSITGLILSPFFIILIGGQIFYILFQSLFFKDNNYKIILLALLSIAIYSGLFANNLISIISSSSMTDKGVGYADFNPNIRFLKDLFFPKFFGSKIMGLIFIVTFISAIVFNYKNIFKKDSKVLFLLILIIFSYITPIIITYIFYSNFSARYIIFVIIPIIILISSFVCNFKTKNKKNYFLFTIIISTILNSFFEISNKDMFKPGFNEIIETINESDTKNFYIYSNYKKLLNKKIDEEKILDKNTIEIVTNYMQAKNKVKKYDLNLLKDNDLRSYNKVWVICYQPSGFYKCNIEKLDKLNFKIINKKISKSITLKLIEY